MLKCLLIAIAVTAVSMMVSGLLVYAAGWFADAAWVTAWATVILFLVTGALAVVAVFQDRLRQFVMRPTLEIILNAGPPDCHLTWAGPSRFPVYYFRLRIKNVGNAPCHQVEVRLQALQEKQANGAFAKVQTFLPLNLKWSHVGTVYWARIPKDLDNFIDCFQIFEPKDRAVLDGERDEWNKAQPTETVLCFDTVVRPNTGSHMLGPGVYRVEVLAAAADADPIRKILEINLTGNWYPNEVQMLGQGVGLKFL